MGMPALASTRLSMLLTLSGDMGSPFGEGERGKRRRGREERPERVAAVEKIEEKRKPDDFFGHRNRKYILVIGLGFLRFQNFYRLL